jgi:carbonic anhydrase/acetyltransferase-like protein (isoleucine patch superfamily)
MAIYQLGDTCPRIDPTAWVAENAIVSADVHLAADANVWWNCVIRGDNDTILIGEKCNIQDSSVLHTDAGIVLELATRVSIGHRVILHGCTVGECSMIGMGSVVMNHARIGAHCLVGANTLIPEGKRFPDGVLILGSPGKVIRELTADERTRLARTADKYVEYSKRYATQLTRIA